MQPVLQFLIVIQFGERAFDQLALTRIDMPVGLGRGHQRLENRLTVLLDLGHRQPVKGLRFGLRCNALLGLPVTVGLVGDHAQRRETAIDRHLATHLAGFLVTQQQPHCPRRQCTAAGTGKQTAKATRATARPLVLRAAGLVLQHVLARLE
ncbi:hypothetical protein D3C76_1463680 [compost metagenome]